jgi:hypothetical protein
MLKIDLSKVYYNVSWTFIRLALIKLQINMEMMNWIMGCIKSTSFIVIINESPSNLFLSSIGLHQGFPLSHFLFLIVVGYLSRLIYEVKSKGILKRMNITYSEFISNFIFVDDIILFGSTSNVKEFHVIKDISDLFFSTTGRDMNMGKSSIRYNALGFEAHEQLIFFFPFSISDIDEGIKYLGFELNQNYYRYVHWLWLFMKISIGLICLGTIFSHMVFV